MLVGTSRTRMDLILFGRARVVPAVARGCAVQVVVVEPCTKAWAAPCLGELFVLELLTNRLDRARSGHANTSMPYSNTPWT